MVPLPVPLMVLAMTEDFEEGASLPRALMWIKDVPLFIDEANLARFYDAVIRPTFRESGPREITVSKEQKQELEGKLKAGGSLHIPSWLSAIFSAGIDVSAEGTGSRASTDGETSVIKLEAISTSERQLEQLTVFYLLKHPDRLLVGTEISPDQWQAQGEADRLPRALAFVDLPPGTKLIPMAAEFGNGHVATFYDKLRAASGEYPPKFEHARSIGYWRWFAEHFDAGQAIEAIEAAAMAESSRVDWIDFRATLAEPGHTLHLHLQAAGRYNNGAFGYQMVRRSFGHGLRIVGTLKAGPDMNVLAIYEK